MNDNIVAVIFSFLSLDKISKSEEIFVENNSLIKLLEKIHNTDSFNIIGKLNNLNSKCGICFSELLHNYVIRLGLFDCKFCNQKKNFNIEICQNCCFIKLQNHISRGKSVIHRCEKGHLIMYYGVNVLSF